jgi:DNA-binding response OmpR family regulator
MRVLIAEDDPVSQQVLATVLKNWGHEVVVTSDGREAWEQLQRDDRPLLAILDRMMPEMSGIDVVKALRRLPCEIPTYVIMLTAMGSRENIVEGLEAGADDYVIKPFDGNELRARVEVGRRMVELQAALAARVHELQYALDHVKTLQHILPICMHCHKIRDDKESWLQIENYLMQHADVQFSHGICLECMEQHYGIVPKPNSEK